MFYDFLITWWLQQEIFYVAAAVRQSSTLFWRDGCLRKRRAWFYFDIPSWSTKSAPWWPAVLGLLHSLVPSCMQSVPSSCDKMCPASYIQQAPSIQLCPDVHTYAWPFPSSGAKLCSASSIERRPSVLSLFHPAVPSFSHPTVPSCAWPLSPSDTQMCSTPSI